MSKYPFSLLLAIVFFLPSAHAFAEAAPSPSPSPSPSPASTASPAPIPQSSPEPAPSPSSSPAPTSLPQAVPTTQETVQAPQPQTAVRKSIQPQGFAPLSSNFTRIGELNACSTVVQPGTYTISRNLAAGRTCIIIDSDNVTLDGRGFSISGDNSANHYGIEVKAHGSIEIKNVKISNFEAGVYIASGANGIKLHDTTLKENMYGVIFREGRNHEIRNNTASNNSDTGLYLDHITSSTVSNNTTADNNVGIYILGGAANTVDGNTVTGSDRGLLWNESSGNTASGNTVNNNNYGIAFEVHSSNNTLTGNTANGNTAAISIAGGRNTIKNQTISNSAEVALRFFESDSINNTIENTIITDTAPAGFDLYFDDTLPNAEAAGVNGNTFINTPIKKYYINPTGGMPIFQNQFGKVEFTEPITGSGDLSEDVRIEQGVVTINPNRPGLNKKATITLGGKTFTAPGAGTYTSSTASGAGVSPQGTIRISPTIINGINLNIDSRGPGSGFIPPVQVTASQITPGPRSSGGPGTIQGKIFPDTRLNSDEKTKADAQEFENFMVNWGSTNPSYDYNQDSKVDLLDFNIMISKWR